MRITNSKIKRLIRECLNENILLIEQVSMPAKPGDDDALLSQRFQGSAEDAAYTADQIDAIIGNVFDSAKTIAKIFPGLALVIDLSELTLASSKIILSYSGEDKKKNKQNFDEGVKKVINVIVGMGFGALSGNSLINYFDDVGSAAFKKYNDEGLGAACNLFVNEILGLFTDKSVEGVQKDKRKEIKKSLESAATASSKKSVEKIKSILKNKSIDITSKIESAAKKSKSKDMPVAKLSKMTGP